MGMIKVGQKVRAWQDGTVTEVADRYVAVTLTTGRGVTLSLDPVWGIEFKVLEEPEPPEGTIVFAKAPDSPHGHFMRLFNDTSTERWAGVDMDNYGCYYTWEDLTSEGYNA